MNIIRTASYYTMRNEHSIFYRLITSQSEGLGYCCVWAFFSRFKRTAVIAARVGVDRSTVKRWKRRFYAGELKCENCERCLKVRARL